MYFVDRQKIEQILVFLEQQIKSFESDPVWEGTRSELALQRIVQVSIDSVLDTGNALIDGFIMRDPGSYEDILDILQDEKVITEGTAIQFKEMLPLRKMLIQDYLSNSHNEIADGFTRNLEAFKQYPAAVREYLANELGPVSAFKN
ncbi:DUF86 domain-containing protein [Actinomycetes bacterium NPDC127524]